MNLCTWSYRALVNSLLYFKPLPPSAGLGESLSRSYGPSQTSSPRKKLRYSHVHLLPVSNCTKATPPTASLATEPTKTLNKGVSLTNSRPPKRAAAPTSHRSADALKERCGQILWIPVGRQIPHFQDVARSEGARRLSR